MDSTVAQGLRAVTQALPRTRGRSGDWVVVEIPAHLRRMDLEWAVWVHYGKGAGPVAGVQLGPVGTGVVRVLLS